MQPKVSRIRLLLYWIEALPAMLAISVIRILPVRFSSAVFGTLARLVGPLLPLTKRAEQNLRAAFPDQSRAERQKIIRDMWENLGRTIGESGHSVALWGDAVERAVVELEEKHARDPEAPDRDAFRTPVLQTKNIIVDGADNFHRLLTLPGPAIIYAAHMGNWELLPVGAAKLGSFTSVVFRTPNNPFVARMVERQRAGLVALLPKGVRGAVAAAGVVEKGGRLGLLVDQKQNRGMAIPFFGRDAMTGTAVAKLALQHKSALFGAYVRRIKGTHFKVTITPPMDYAVTGDEAADIRAILTRINADIESWVREDPAQWLWLHRRWPKK